MAYGRPLDSVPLAACAGASTKSSPRSLLSEVPPVVAVDSASATSSSDRAWLTALGFPFFPGGGGKKTPANFSLRRLPRTKSNASWAAYSDSSWVNSLSASCKLASTDNSIEWTCPPLPDVGPGA